MVDERLAWALALPAAALTLAAVLLLGEPLGKLLFPASTLDFWPSALVYVIPEPTEQARFLIALAGATLVPLGVIALARWGAPRPSLGLELASVFGQLSFVAVAIAAVLCSRDSVRIPAVGYFTVASVVFAAVVAAAIATALAWPPARERSRRLAHLDSTWVRIGAAAVAALATAIWLLPAIQLEDTIGHAQLGTSYGLEFTFDEGLTVLNGHAPLVDFSAQYGSLWPYAIALPLKIAGATLGTYTSLMVAISWLAMLAVYGVIRRVARSPLAALALFLPFLATSFFLAQGTLVERYSFAEYFGIFPLRYAGPFFLAWMLARHLGGEQPRRAVWVFLVAGLALLNNGDFGVPALGATIVALAAAAESRSRAWAGRLALEAAGGLLAAYALVAALTLAVAGELPDVGLLFGYARLFALAGYYMLPMQWFGLWAAIYLTYCAALGCAAMRVVRRDGDRVATGMLAWVGIFGLGAGAYYVGRSHSEVLIATFSAWGLALVLLLAVTARSSEPRRFPGPARLALFAGFGLLVCSLAQFPTPWQQVERLREAAPTQTFNSPAEVDFIDAHTRPGQPVILLSNLGQRVSRAAGVDDVLPYTGMPSMPSQQQLDDAIEQLREKGGRTIFVRVGDSWTEIPAALEERGFELRASSGVVPIVDTNIAARILMFSPEP